MTALQFLPARDREFLLVGRRSAEPEGFFLLWIFASFGVFSGEEIFPRGSGSSSHELQLPLRRRKS
jgi:hypothetical protein